MNDLGERIRKDRLARNLTLKEFAKRVGIGVMTLQRIETGKTIPNVHALIGIARELNKSVDKLLNAQGKGFCKVIKNKERRKVHTKGLRLSVLSPPEMEKNGVSVSYLTEKEGTTLGPLKGEKRWIFVYQMTGQVTFIYMGKEHKMKGGDCLYFDGNHEHIVKIEKDTESLLVSIKQ